MYRLLWILLSSLTLTIACRKSAFPPANLAQDQFVQAYFNHRQNVRYIDPYRQFQRTGDNLEAIIIDGIESATSSIDLAVQELNLPLIAQALVKKQQSGVEVRLILDNKYSQILSNLQHQEIQNLNQRDRQKYNQFVRFVDINQDQQLSPTEIAQRDALYMLRQGKVKLIDDTADGSKGSGLMHHKFMVIDQQKVVTGSANFTLSGIHGDIDRPETLGNVNHLLVIANPQLAKMFTEEFNFLWGNSSQSQFGLDKPRRLPASITWQDTKVTLQFAPTSKTQPWQVTTNGLISETISKATQSIDLALFVFSSQEIANALQRKQHQGLEIYGVFDAGFAFRYYSEVLDLLGVALPGANTRRGDRCQTEINNNPWRKPLTTIGIANLSSGDKLHHKFAVIDNHTVISGSHNWSAAANHQNDETLLVIENQQVAQHFIQEFDHFYQTAAIGLSAKIQKQLQKLKQQCF